MSLFDGLLIAATILSGLVAGFVFAFAVVVMPGLGRLADGEFLRAFQAVDRVIQDGQPLFMAVWLGSTVCVLGAVVSGWGTVAADDRSMLILASMLSVFGVQFPTVTINIPLNNAVQQLVIAEMDEPALSAARANFEPRWNRWNTIRTAAACVVTMLLAGVLLRVG